MCIDPVTAISIGSGALGAAGSLMSGSANAQAAGLAAQTAKANADMALAEGSGKAAQIDMRVGQSVGRTRAAFGAGNIAINSGSSLNDQVQSAIQGNTDKQLAIAGSLNASAGQRFQAGQDYMKQSQDQMAGVFGAGTALLLSLAYGFRGGGFGGMGGMGGSISNLPNFNIPGVAPGFMTGAYGF